MEEVVSNDVVEENVNLSKIQSRRWFLTINNETRSDEELCDYISSLEHFKYYCFQRERGEKEHTEHIQLYLVFTIGKRFNTVKSYFERAHIEKARGSNVQCRDYCSKKETRISGPYEAGEFAEQRARTDITNLYEMIDSGASDLEIRTAYPSLYAKMSKFIEEERQKSLSRRFLEMERNVKVTYIYGPPGSGKSTYVSKFGYKNLFKVLNYKKNPFDGYNGQDILWLEEFNGQFPIEFCLALLDKYPLDLPCRYIDKVACFTKVYITTNLPPENQYSKDDIPSLQRAAFLRRLHNIGYMNLNHEITWLKKEVNGKQISILDDTDLVFGEKEHDETKVE